jgi:Rrf2 family transcriptional regulator, iron-sulfur cluster assembly transcription factor
VEIIRRGTDYAMRALVHMALSGADAQSVSAIAQAEGIPVVFLQKLMQKLTKAGIVHSQVGVQGGVGLARPAGEITLKDIMEATQGRIAISNCVIGKDRCGHEATCPLRSGWTDVQARIDEFLGGLNLAELAVRASGIEKESKR